MTNRPVPANHPCIGHNDPRKRSRMELATPMTETPAQAFDALLQRHRGIVLKIAGS